LEIVGRVDHQVKIRGFRVELEDVEAALHQHPATRRAAVVVPEGAAEDTRLVAYVVSDDEPAPTWLEWRAFLAARLPDHMIPAAFVSVAEIPLTPSGKIDRRALAARPAPLPTRGRDTADAPRTATEDALGRIW